MTMTPDAKAALSKTMRALRAELLDKLESALVGAYRLDLSTQEAQLDAHPKARRRRLDDWLDSRVGHLDGVKRVEARRRARDEVVHQAASTWLNRLVLLRLMEASGLQSPVLTGGWHSRAYKDFREQAPALCNDESQGYQTLLELVFGELAQELPGLFGAVGLMELVPMPPEILRRLVEALDQPVLESCWTDDLTLGWVYQYWNDPARKRLDDKVNPKKKWGSGKIEPHEIASKTQMFTERYMVDWLLQNSLGPMWLAMCDKHGWSPESQEDGTLDRLAARRVDWRAKRDAGEVPLTELMPLDTQSEHRWAYYVPQPIAVDAVTHAPESVRGLKILDPAVGSGHFLVVAFDLLVALYREEARHRGEAAEPQWSNRAIAESILENNLHGIDLDPRAVQIAAATLWLKAKEVSREARPLRMNLVASKLELASLADDDPAVVELRREIERDTGIPGALTDQILWALRGADHLGSLLKVDDAIGDALDGANVEFRSEGTLPLLHRDDRVRTSSQSEGEARHSVLGRIERFLARHTGGDDLGLRLRGEQLAAGVRLVRLVREGGYDLVVANPPYQGTSKLAEATYVKERYPLGKADLYAAFMVRGLELVRPGGMSAMVTIRNWMFIQQFAKFRQFLFEHFDLRTLGDVSWGAFAEMRDNPVALSVVRRGKPSGRAVATAPTDPQTRVRTKAELERKRAGLRCQVGRHEFDPEALKVIPEWPLLYWWSDDQLRRYVSCPKVADIGDARAGLQTSNNTRFLRTVWEVALQDVYIQTSTADHRRALHAWVPYIKGAAGKAWIEPLEDVVRWHPGGLAIKTFERNGKQASRPQNEQYYFQHSTVFPSIGSDFRGRRTRYLSIFGNAGLSLFTPDVMNATILLNSAYARLIVGALNPTVNFLVGDVLRLPFVLDTKTSAVWAVINESFDAYESHRESSIEFVRPGATAWEYAKDWAQTAADRPEGAALPAFQAAFDPEPPTNYLSFGLGVALGRFGENGEGILDPTTDDLSNALPDGILFLSVVPGHPAHDLPRTKNNTLDHPACALLRNAWDEHGHATNNPDLLTWLRNDFLHLHLAMYENKPIHWPLSSTKKSFVAWVNIHRMSADTLRTLLADEVLPEQKRLRGIINDLEKTRQAGTPEQRNDAEELFGKLTNWAEELEEYIENLRTCSEEGPPPPDAKTPPRDRDARDDPDLHDGVMINSAALWPLLEPQWTKPKTWWKELATAKKGNKDYDWSHLATRYWPERVDAKCRIDPSLGVAHGCFWRYHPERAYDWELRFQDEIAPDFTIDEDDSDACRAAFRRDHPEKVVEIRDKERKRRKKKAKKHGTTPKPLSGDPGELNLGSGELWPAKPEAGLQ